MTDDFFRARLEQMIAAPTRFSPWLRFDEQEKSVIFNREWAEKNYKNDAKSSA
jgi:hypothetical protein